MNIKMFQVIFRFLLSFLLLINTAVPSVEANDLLYDPEPPADSAYVRVIHVSNGGTVDVLVDGKLRIHNLSANDASNYMVLAVGKHSIALQSIGSSVVQVETMLDVDKGQAITVALKSKANVIIFDDKANSNKLKAVLAVYHLDPQSGSLDVLTADGKTKVFTKLAPGTSNQLSVNPITVELIAVKSGSQTALARTMVAMEPGGVFSILLIGSGGKLIARSVKNKVERYTGVK